MINNINVHEVVPIPFRMQTMSVKQLVLVEGK